VRQSNSYVLIFTLIMTIIVGGVLALANQLLMGAQKESIELDTKSSILKAVTTVDKKTDVLDLYNKRIKSIVVDINGNEIAKGDKGEPLVAENVDVSKEFKKDYKERKYPVFKYMSESNPDQVEAYIVPVYGSGLWDRIWGFVAIKNDLETIAGVSFAHKGETPGLGARISEQDIQSRYVGKSIYNDNGNFVSVTMVKGEAGGGGESSISAFNDKPNQVDGLSGATLTAKGVNEMVKKYMGYYQKYFRSIK